MDRNTVKVNPKNIESSIGGLYVVSNANNHGSTTVHHAMWSAKRAVVVPTSLCSKKEYLDMVTLTKVVMEGRELDLYR